MDLGITLLLLLVKWRLERAPLNLDLQSISSCIIALNWENFLGIDSSGNSHTTAATLGSIKYLFPHEISYIFKCMATPPTHLYSKNLLNPILQDFIVS